MPDDQTNISCRICFVGESQGKLISPCNCSGIVAYVHQKCLEKWLETKQLDHCAICKMKLPIQRIKKSFCDWIQANNFGVTELIKCTICWITYAIISIVCLLVFWWKIFDAQHFDETFFISMLLIPPYYFIMIIIRTIRCIYSRFNVWQRLNTKIQLIGLNDCCKQIDVEDGRNFDISIRIYLT